MEIPSNDLRVKNRIIQEKAKAADSKAAAESSADSGVSSSSASGQGASAEQINLSSKAKDIQKAKDLAKSAPDIRMDKVNSIKQQIANGSYNVNSKSVADKMLKDILTKSSYLE